MILKKWGTHTIPRITHHHQLRTHIPCNTSNPSLPFNLTALKQLHVINPHDLENKI